MVIPLSLMTKDGVQEVKQRPDMHQRCCHGASYSIELAHEGAEALEHELVALIEQQRCVDLAANVMDLCVLDL